MRFALARTALAAVLLALGMATAMAEMPPRQQDIVLVVQPQEAVRWVKVTRLLKERGLEVTVANTLGALRQVLAERERPTVLVAPGWSGVFVSEIGGDPKVSALVYVAALAPEAGEDHKALIAPIEGAGTFSEPWPRTTQTAWREKKNYYAVIEQDGSISPERQHFFAARMKAKTIVLPSFESEPRAIAGLILEAAGLKSPACGAAEDEAAGPCAAPALPRSLAEGCKCTKGSLEDLTAP